MKKLSLILAMLICATVAFGQEKKEKAEKTKAQYNSIIDLIRVQGGVIVGPDNGSAMPSIIVRGVSTNSGESMPLFVVDDVITDNIMHILPDDVDSIEIIKDGTSAIYGIRGANGVIMIKTKSYAEQQAKIAQQAREAKELAKKQKAEAKAAKKAAK